MKSLFVKRNERLQKEQEDPKVPPRILDADIERMNKEQEQAEKAAQIAAEERAKKLEQE